MLEVYHTWINAYVASQPNGFVRGKCDEATKLMVDAFPELRRVAGFAHVWWGRDQHWWCLAPDGTIVDPTASQFPGGLADYEELDLEKDRERIPTGVCMHCGEEVYGGKLFCGDACERATLAYLNVR